MSDKVTYVMIRVVGEIDQIDMEAAALALENMNTVDNAELYQFKTVSAQEEHECGTPVIYFP